MPARIAAALKHAFGERLVSALLYGSRARGDERADSDYDVLVLLRNPGSPDWDRLRRIAGELAPPDRPSIYLMPYPPDALAQRTTFMFNVRHDAVPLPGLPWPEVMAPPTSADGASMKPETATLLEFADTHLADARNIQRAGVQRSAARESYTAALAAARALIFEERNIAPKTRKGTDTLFQELAVKTNRIPADLSDVLTKGLEIKNQADYEPRPKFTAADFAEYVDRASVFVAAVKKLIEERGAT
jgi:uncharacterized protein (UPF0332 family)